MAREPVKAEDYPDTYEGYVASWIAWLEGMRDTEQEFPDENVEAAHPGTSAAIVSNFNEVITLIQSQLTAIQIVQTMMEEMYRDNPSPRMKALKAAIEAIYRG